MASVNKDTALAEAQAMETASHDAEKKDHITAHEAEYVEHAEKHEPSAAWVEDTPEEKKLVRKIDMWLMPSIWILYMFSYMVGLRCRQLRSVSDSLRRIGATSGTPASPAWKTTSV